MSIKRPLRGVSVLVVDDDADCRNVLRQMVEWFGARVHTARDGHEALAWLAKQTPDLLLLDLRMPGMDGFTVFERLRADPRFSKLRAVAVTALGSDPDVMRTWEAGFDGHLVKPVDIETLAAALNRAFWAHSGELRFSVWHAPTTTKRPRRRELKTSPTHLVDILAQRAGQDVAPADHAEGRPEDVAPTARKVVDLPASSGSRPRRGRARLRAPSGGNSARKSSRAS